MHSLNLADYDTISADFYAYMESAPEEQKDSFKYAIMQLMSCYGANPRKAILAGFVDRDKGSLEVSGLCLDPEETHVVATLMLATIEDGQKTAPEGSVLQ